MPSSVLSRRRIKSLEKHRNGMPICPPICDLLLEGLVGDSRFKYSEECRKEGGYDNNLETRVVVSRTRRCQSHQRAPHPKLLVLDAFQRISEA